MGVEVREFTNVERLLLILAKEARMNTRQIARAMGKTYIYIRNLLYDLKTRGLVNNEYVRRFFPHNKWIMVNEWWITKEGREWLKARKLLSN